MDIGKSVGFVFEDKDWVPKVLIGGLVSLIPIVNLAAEGYALRTMRNVAAGEERPLPEWSNFGEHFIQGLYIFIAGLIYAAPAIVLSMMAGTLGQLHDSGDVGAMLAMASAWLACAQGLYSLLLGLWLPAATINYAASGDLGAFFRFGEIWDLISRLAGDYILALVMTIVVGIVAALAGVVLCLVGLLFTMFVASLIYAHLFGQVLAASGRPLKAPAA